MVSMEQRLDSLNTSLQVASTVVTEYLEVLMELQIISQLLKRKNAAKSSDGVDLISGLRYASFIASLLRMELGYIQ